VLHALPRGEHPLFPLNQTCIAGASEVRWSSVKLEGIPGQQQALQGIPKFLVGVSHRQLPHSDGDGAVGTFSPGEQKKRVCT
jgi:hypothetical protein